MAVHLKTCILATALLAAGGSAAIAQESDDREAATQPQAAQSENEDAAEAQEDDPSQEVICRRERVTGSLSRVRRTCLTRAEWDRIESGTRDALNQTNRNASGGQCITNGISGRC